MGEDLITIEAELERIIFQSQDKSFAIGLFEDLESGESFTAKGRIFNPKTGRDYTLQGVYVKDPKYGRQFQVYQCEMLLPKARESVVSFLSSYRFSGIGKKTAEAIYDTLGENAIDRIVSDPSVLESECHLNSKKADAIKEGLEQLGLDGGVYVRLLNLGLSDKEASLLTEGYPNLEQVLEKDCFDPYYHLHGFGYESMLRLADGLKVPVWDTRRLDAALYETIKSQCMNRGDTYLPAGELYQMFSSVPKEDLDTSLETLYFRNLIYKDQDKVYPWLLYNSEQTIAALLKEHEFPVEKVDEAILEELIESAEAREHIQYDPVQKQAIKQFFNTSLMILNGGPGTGKSTTVKGILDICSLLFPDADIQLCAPTGRASKRLSALSDANSKTIHSLLKWDASKNVFNVNEENPLDIDFLIVDEFSMVDTWLFASLLKALPERCRILLIGDEDQLESVSPGKVFNDLIDSKKVPIVSLETLFRQKEGSGIAQLAEEIRKEKKPAYQDGVEFLPLEGEQIVRQLEELIHPEDDVYAVQVLAPKYKGPAGINEINARMQELLNPFSPAKAQFKTGSVVFRVGDKVLLKKNLTDLGVFNGDVGVISAIDVEGKVIEVTFDDDVVAFDSDYQTYLTHAWCVSVHKSQGSEYQKVFCVVEPNARFMLKKRLLYTAISRAKKKLFILGDRQTFETGIKSKEQYQRRTTLKERLEEAWGQKRRLF